MHAPLTEQLLADFQQDGVIALRGVIDRHWQARLAAAVDDDIRHPGPYFHGYETSGAGRFHGNLRLWESHPVFREFCLRSPLPEIARLVLGSNRLNLLYDQLFVKEATTAERTRWHNDQPYWPIRGWQVASIWVALDTTTIDSGALEFIRGSHRWGRWFQPELFGKTSAIEDYARNPDFEPMPDIQSRRDDYDIVSFDLEPGDAYVFHGLTVHGAGGNARVDRPRRGYAVRYTGDDIVYDTRPGTNPTLCNPHLTDGAVLDSPQYPRVSRPPPE